MSDASQPPTASAGSRRMLEPGDRVGRFQVESVLGSGGMGEVYKAWDATLERSVALKALRPGEEREAGSLERFRREALALAQLNHPHVCQVHDWVDSPGGAFIAMELVQGETLDRAAPQLKVPEKLQVILAVARALEAAHAKGIVHRDLKPGNIMVAPAKGDRGLQVKVLDFGLARIADPQGMPGSSQLTPPSVPNLALLQALEAADREAAEGSSHTALSHSEAPSRAGSGSNSWERLTQVGTFMGSPGYASPEQIQGQTAGSSSDIFSLGIVAWELLAGEHPFPGEGRSRMRAIVEGARRELRVRGLPSGTADLLRAMLEAHPFKRPSAAKVSENLERLMRPRLLLRWATITVLTAILFAGGLNWFLGRGIIADLTRQHPARLALVPFDNLTGDPLMDPMARIVLPEMLEAALRELPKVSPVDMDTLSRARASLHMPPDGTLSDSDQARLSKALGTQLMLRGSLKKLDGGGFVLAYELVDANGTVRQSGEARESGKSDFVSLPLARKASIDLIKAVDPIASTSRGLLPDIPSGALAAYARGTGLMARGSFKEAAPAFEEATHLAPDFPPAVLSYANCLSHLANTPAEPVFQWARWAARAQGNRVYEMKALHHLSIRFEERGQRDASDRASMEALKLARALGDSVAEATIHSTMGVNLRHQHKNAEAEAEFQKALAMYQAVGNKLDATRVLNNLAVLEREQGDLKGAEARYQGALQTVRDYDDKWGEAIITNNLGDLALAQEGGLDRAEHSFRKAQALRESIGDQKGLVYTLMGLASVHQARGDLDRAEDLVRQFLEQARKTQLRPMEALGLYNLGELKRCAQDFNASRSYYEQSLALHHDLGDSVMEAHCLAGQAECMAREGRRGMARVLLDKCHELSAEETPYILRAKAWLARSERNSEESRALFEKALATARTQAPEIVRELKEALR